MRRLIPKLFPVLALVSLVLTDRGRAESPDVFVASIDPATHERGGLATAAFGPNPENGTLTVTVPPTSRWIDVARSGDSLDHEALTSPAPTTTAGVSDGKPLSGVADTATDTGMVVAGADPGARPPAVPAAPTVVPAAVGGTATLLVTWDAPADNGSPITGYLVRWRTMSSERFTVDNVTIGPGTTATITGLASSTAHRVRVRAVNVAGKSGWSRPGDGRTDNAPPSFSGDGTVTVTVAGDAVTVRTFTATDPDDPTLAYSLSGADASRFGISPVGVLTVGSGGLPDPNAPGNTTLTVTVGVSDRKSRTGTADTAVDASINVTVVVVNAAPPDTPDAPTVTPAAVGGTATLLVSWVAPADNGSPITGYLIRWRTMTSERFREDNVTTEPGSTTATITGLASLTAHRVRVRAVNAAGKSGWSRPGDGRTDNASPVFSGDATVKITVAENTATVGTFTATDPENDTLTYSLSGEDAPRFDIDSNGQVTALPNQPLDHESLSAATLTITVQVSDGRSRTGDADTEVDASSEVVIVVLSPPSTPAAPTVAPAAVGGTATLSVSWTPPADNGSPITAYAVQWRVKTDATNGAWTANTVTGAAVTITGLRSSTPHEVRIKAINTEGESEWSEPGEGRTDNTPPVFPGTAATVTVTENAATVGTFVAFDPDDLTLTYSLSGADASVFGVDPGGEVTVLSGHSLEHETSGTPALTITVLVSDGRSLSGDVDLSVDASLVVAVVVTAASRPATPTPPTVTPAAVEGTVTLSVSWTAPADNGSPITAYVVQWRVKTAGGGGTFTGDGVSLGSGVTATMITGLMSSTPHEVRVRAENAVGVSDWSTPGEGRTNNAPPTFPGNVTQTVTITENSVTVGTFAATDDDDATLTYSLSGENTSRFGIDTDGEVTVVANNLLDYETPGDRVSTVTVRVSDGKSLSGAADTSIDASLVVVIKVANILLPAAPSAPTVTAPLRGGSANLAVRWAAPVDNGAVITGYAVQWREKTTADNSGETFTADNVWTIQGRNSARITGLTPSTTYEVRIRADSAEGSSRWSELGEGRTGNQSPAFPPSISVTVAEGSNTAGTFTAFDHDNPTLTYALSGADASRFRIGTDGEVTVAGDPLDYETITDRFLVIVVEASDGLSPSGGPDTEIDTRMSVVIVVTDIPPPDAPEILSVTAPNPGGATTLVVTWTEPEDNGSPIARYVVQRRAKASDNNGTFTSDGVVISGTTATITNLLSSAPYEVRVRTDSEEGNSAWSMLGEGLTNPNLDLNGNRQIDAYDGMLVFYAIEYRDTLEEDLDLAVTTFSANRWGGRTRGDAREILEIGRRLENVNPSPVDLNTDSVFDGDDALIIFYAYQFDRLLRANRTLSGIVFGEHGVDSVTAGSSEAFVDKVHEKVRDYNGSLEPSNEPD